MSLVITNNVQSLTAQNNLSRNTAALARSLERLSSGVKINRGADGPAALVISEKQRAQIAGLGQAIENTEKAVTMVQTAEGALTEMNALLVKARTLAIDAANAGVNDADSLAASQAELDKALDTIERIANNTQFGTTKLLDGTLSASKVLDASVTSFSQTGLATGNYGVTFGGAWVKSTVNDDWSNAEALAVTNETGGTAEEDIDTATTMNGAGTMSILDGTGGTLASVNYADAANLNATLQALQTAADNANVGVNVDFTAGSGGNAANMGVTAQDYGSYAVGYDLQISNGTAYSTTSATPTSNTNQTMGGTLVDNAGAMSQVGNRGNTFQNAAGTVSITFNNSVFTGAFTSANAVEAATGAVYQIGANQNQTASVDISSAKTSDIGVVGSDTLASLLTGGSQTLTAGNAQSALAIIDQAIDDVTGLRSTLGAFQANTLESTANNLRATMENVVAAESVIRDTDFAAEIANFTKQQILQQAGVSVLANANQTPQLVLSLLQG